MSSETLCSSLDAWLETEPAVPLLRNTWHSHGAVTVLDVQACASAACAVPATAEAANRNRKHLRTTFRGRVSHAHRGEVEQQFVFTPQHRDVMSVM